MALSKIKNASTDGTIAGGKVLQVQQTIYRGRFADSISTNDHEEVVTGLNCSITPSSSSSKVLVQYLVHVGASSFYDIAIRLYRNVTANSGAGPLGTELVDSSGNDIQGTQVGSRPVSFSTINLLGSGVSGTYKIIPAHGMALDHPNTTSAQTYSFAFKFYNWAGAAIYVNRTNNDGNAAGYEHVPVSTMTLMEIA